MRTYPVREAETGLRCIVAGVTQTGPEPAGDVYTHGHQEAVLRSHRWRTAANSAAYLLDRLRPGMDLLDVGCGPATLTVDLGRLVAPGTAVGVDREPAVIAEASSHAESEGALNTSFSVGEAYALEFPSQSFDVVHAHQVLQHLTKPVAALVEMRRLLRPGGLLAVRDSDYGGFVWWPPDPGLDRWLTIYHDVCSQNGAEADAGRRLPQWVREAGFAEMAVSTSTWTFADAESRNWWCGLWADRVVQSSFAEQAIDYGLATAEELRRIAAAWRNWGEQDNGLFVVLHTEVLATRSVLGRAARR
jgi:ubiquinone/menaquinone biosynthesis C-methylase UbiE